MRAIVRYLDRGSDGSPVDGNGGGMHAILPQENDRSLVSTKQAMLNRHKVA